jgi:hypothetical protein
MIPARCHNADADSARFFKPKYLPAYGTLQDGGLKHNNPARPGLHEVRRTCGDDDCDVVLSIGTGFEQKLLKPAPGWGLGSTLPGIHGVSISQRPDELG